MPDPIHTQSGSTGKHWPEAGWMILARWLAFGPDPFGQNLTQSARIKSDPGRFCTVLSGTSVEEWNWVWKWETGSRPVASCQKLGLMIPAHQLASRPDVFGQTPITPSRSDPGQFCTVWSMPALEKQSWNRCGIYNLGRFWLHAGHDSHNWLAETKMLPDWIRHVYWDSWCLGGVWFGVRLLLMDVCWCFRFPPQWRCWSLGRSCGAGVHPKPSNSATSRGLPCLYASPFGLWVAQWITSVSSPATVFVSSPVSYLYQ